ncbi:unannotated protein [freshwater metagenome]|uniref:Unannotated protein n=1 Tax=freshwater metagenome TaxID=449393 RepID=A0A6J7JLQ0_9ZZZZ|nr:calcium-binding protein [Actinomycetota bacterium]
MRTRRFIPLLLIAIVPAVSADAATPKKYKNCAALNRVYPHGVGKPRAHDKASGDRVTNFRVSRTVYNANKGKDRDHDGIACEKL